MSKADACVLLLLLLLLYPDGAFKCVLRANSTAQLRECHNNEHRTVHYYYVLFRCIVIMLQYKSNSAL
jgi:hypothetical protein